ncbi:PCI domain-containing protein [Paraphysoderma sedebokerense]|nr:PCI domain-containing protein [Paraphysoderma sedebokerense]
MEKDFGPTCDQVLPQTTTLAQNGKLNEALEQLMVLEKQTRNGADLASNTRVLIHIIKLCYESKNLKALNENIVVLSKKHGALKQAITKMVQEAMTYVEKLTERKQKLELIETLRTVTEGKIYVEVERARLTRILSQMKEAEGNMVEAADILQELQVETFGSMEKREKTDFILEQMRLCLAKKDYTRTQIISRKINTKYFDDVEVSDLKLRYYELMIQHALHSNQYLNICKYYRHVFDTKSIQDEEAKWKEILCFVVTFIVMSPYDNEQSDLIHRIYQDEKLGKVPVYKDLIKLFITPELMRWPKIEEIYGVTLKKTYAFDTKTEGGVTRWNDFHKRVIEHNIRVIAKYYTRITTKRLTQLLDLPEKDAEDFLSRLVVSKTIYAKIDRPSGIITFRAAQNPEELLNNWSRNIKDLLGLIEKTGHLITKEEMVAGIKKVNVGA